MLAKVQRQAQPRHPESPISIVVARGEGAGTAFGNPPGNAAPAGIADLMFHRRAAIASKCVAR